MIVLKCAYCDKKSQQTREHVSPAGTTTRPARPRRSDRPCPVHPTQGRLIVKDVCRRLQQRRPVRLGRLRQGVVRATLPARSTRARPSPSIRRRPAPPLATETVVQQRPRPERRRAGAPRVPQGHARRVAAARPPSVLASISVADFDDPDQARPARSDEQGHRKSGTALVPHRPVSPRRPSYPASLLSAVGADQLVLPSPCSSLAPTRRGPVPNSTGGPRCSRAAYPAAKSVLPGAREFDVYG